MQRERQIARTVSKCCKRRENGVRGPHCHDSYQGAGEDSRVRWYAGYARWFLRVQFPPRTLGSKRLNAKMVAGSKSCKSGSSKAPYRRLGKKCEPHGRRPKGNIPPIRKLNEWRSRTKSQSAKSRTGTDLDRRATAMPWILTLALEARIDAAHSLDGVYVVDGPRRCCCHLAGPASEMCRGWK